ncbi:hypothetical protein CDL15_Pgr000098 [Punica granatum]|nr:hypothetical protein CDL15_Pgr000098 [Punica granatum]
MVRTVNDEKILDIGVILNLGSLVGKEARAAIEISSQDFNSISRGYKLKLHHENSGGKPLLAVSSAEKLIKRKKVKAIIGLETWKVAELVAELGNRFQVPMISLAGNQFGRMIPGVIQMVSNKSEQLRCMANIVRTYNRHRASIIYEDMYDDNYSLSLYLSKELHNAGSEIEEQVVLPPYSSLSDPAYVVKQKLGMFKGKLSPVFIVLDLSLPMASHLLKEAKQMGFFRGDSIWVLSESVLNLLNSVHSNVTFSMRGAIGVVTDLPRKNKQYLDFIHKFHRKLNHEARDSMPGIHVLRAYDSITMVTKAMDGASSSAEITSKLLMKRMLQSKFDGLSGQVAFIEGQILNPRKPKLVSISDGTKLLYKDLNIWSPQNALSAANNAVPELKHGIKESKGGEATCSVSDVHLSGPMKIGVPRHTPFDKFVKEVNDSSGKTLYIGFCIEVFESILSVLKSTSAQTFDDYHFVPHNGSYDDLVQEVHNKTYNVAVGDITILANRSENVDFTQPFMESGLSMIVVAEPDKTDSLIFLKPFTPTMWLASGGVLIFTMLTVWFLERSKSPAFQGKKLTDQLATALWFTFCSLFHAHGDIIYRNLTRIVLVVWFFEALILTQSYTASLTSMLTVQKLKQNQITMEWLKQNNARVGCDNSTFVCDLLERAHNFRKDTIVGINNYTEFHEQLNNGIIKAIFVEYPYERAFLTRYCSGFSVTHQSYRFGGFGFAFEKGSPWTKKFSEAILELSESGKLKQMEDKSFQKECLMEKANATASSDSKTQSLGLGSFWALHVYSLGTSALCLLLSWFRSRRNGDSGHANIADGQPNGASQREHRNLEMDELHDQTR